MIEAGIRLPPRESMNFDVVIAGAGPAGLAAAIRLKQLNPDVSVVVVEKGAELGAHILSGAVIDPCALDKLLPGWHEDQDRPLTTGVTADWFYVLGPKSALRLPNFIMPRLMNNHGNFIGSLGNVVRFLGKQAEALGVDIFPGFAGAEILYGGAGEV
jgi:electron-transferring-flavoprotein dehydrogenase